jgi:hypothetical protein
VDRLGLRHVLAPRSPGLEVIHREEDFPKEQELPAEDDHDPGDERPGQPTRRVRRRLFAVS